MSGKKPNMWKLNHTVLSNPWIKEKIMRKFRKHSELHENEKAIYQYLQYAAKVVLRGSAITLSTYIRKEERYKVNYNYFNFDNLGKI